jgi:hypothetical protein
MPEAVTPAIFAKGGRVEREGRELLAMTLFSFA